MAYLNFLAAVSPDEVQQLQLRPRSRLQPKYRSAVSHLIAYEFPHAPLSGFLGRAIDGGEVVHASYWHPLRVPVYHRPDEVEMLARLMRASSHRLRRTHPGDDGDWHWAETEKVIRLFQQAAQCELCVLSALEPPADWLRARKVWVPLS